MDWGPYFSAVNALALIAWVALAFLPRWPALLSAILYLCVGLLCLIYAFGLIGAFSGLLPPGFVVEGGGGADFTTIAIGRASGRARG